MGNIFKALHKTNYMIIKCEKKTFNVIKADTFLKQVLGLMFRFPKENGLILWFNKEKYVALHTFFVFFPIDIIYLNNDKEVVKIRRNIKPFIALIPHVKCKYIVELKNAENVKLKDKFSF